MKKKMNTDIENDLKSISKFRKIKIKIRELLEESTSHGIPKICKTKNLLILIIWSICTLFSICSCSYFIIDTVFDYLKYKTIANIEIINEQEASFPALSICALPSFNLSLNQTIVFSRFDNIVETNFSQYYEVFNDVNMGKCFRYNSGKNIYNQSYPIHNSTINGYKYGLKLNMKIQIPDEYDYAEIYVFIHNQSLPPFDTNNGRGFWIAPGSYNYFELDRVFYQKLDSPYSDCLNDVNSFKMNKSLIDKILNDKRAYTQTDCYYLCSNLFALQESNCGCNSTFDDFSQNCIRQYNKAETILNKCMSEYLKLFRKKDQYKKCNQYCPMECFTINYLINAYSYQLPVNGNVSKISKSNFYTNEFNTYEEIKRSFFGIRVYYNDLKYTLISEEPKTKTFNFVSNIGGILGAFLGISFLSFIEIFQIFYEIFSILLS
jgi:hypothetical protein